ncbi:MAG: hypothetical protein ACOCZ5_01150 [bacterium]
MRGRKQNIELKNLIYHLLGYGLTAKEIKLELDKKLNEDSPHIETVKRYKKILKQEYYNCGFIENNYGIIENENDK